MTTRLKRAGTEKYLIVRVDTETHRALKVKAAQEGTSVQRIAKAALMKVIAKRGRP
jgi:predicted HicB family RNase H-like nuclease